MLLVMWAMWWADVATNREGHGGLAGGVILGRAYGNHNRTGEENVYMTTPNLRASSRGKPIRLWPWVNGSTAARLKSPLITSLILKSRIPGAWNYILNITLINTGAMTIARDIKIIFIGRLHGNFNRVVKLYRKLFEAEGGSGLEGIHRRYAPQFGSVAIPLFQSSQAEVQRLLGTI
jgi:hypothetical protein